MRKKERIQFILYYLDKVYPQTPIPLNHKNSFELLVSVLLSAQCTDERVNKVTPELFSIADNPMKMARVNTNKIYSIIRPCGLAPKKSKAISSLSKIFCTSYIRLSELSFNIDQKENKSRYKSLIQYFFSGYFCNKDKNTEPPPTNGSLYSSK